MDAARIAEYRLGFDADLLVADVPVLQGIAELRNLLSLRSKLVKDRSGYLCRQMPAHGTLFKSEYYYTNPGTNYRGAYAAIKKTEDQIRLIIRTNEVLKNLHVLTSIKGVGLIVAAYMIANTVLPVCQCAEI
ncbi:MAG: hypothetical protein IPP93_05625 [Chitinophagaceae bacterium]|nr:hypothetical protein [Chitinophagaceae bacterium]